MLEYGQTNQYEKGRYEIPPLDEKSTKDIQSKLGPVLYYLLAVDITILPALNEIVDSQAKHTLRKKIATDMLLDYAHTYPNTKIRYYTSDMILNDESDAAYLVMSGLAVVFLDTTI